MTKTNGSEHAFPHLHFEMGMIDLKGGLSKREYFAAMAMQGLCADPSFPEDMDIEVKAIEIADDLIAELNKVEE